MKRFFAAALVCLAIGSLPVCAREFDAETGLIHMGFRDYDPETGRFLQEDPIGFAGGDVNLYAYVHNNPIRYVDPLGLSPVGSGTDYYGCYCPAQPAVPPRTSPADNICEAKSHRDPRWFINQMGNGGPWDYKRQFGREYEDFGNFNYGAVSAGIGLPDQITFRIAGFYSERAGTYRSNWGHWYGRAPYGDDPRDQQWIQAGIRSTRCQCF